MIDISIWLIPQKKQKDDLQIIINTLAEKYQTFPFLPHITAYWLGESTSLPKAIATVQPIIKDARPLKVTLDEISYSDEFIKTLFARYQISPALQSLYKKLKEAFYDVQPYELIPHLSLIYKNNMREEDKLREMKQIKVPKQLILDKVALITKNGSKIGKEKDVLDWRVGYELQLV